MFKKVVLLCLFSMLVFANVGQAQLDQVFNRVFDKVLKDDLQLSPGNHAQHYFPAAETANETLTPGLNALIASNIASFPLTSTVAGVTFDFSTGQPVSITESLGPIFAETAETLGKGKLNLSFNYSYLSLDQLRGIDTQDIGFTFTHEDVNGNGVLGDIAFEADYMDFQLGLDVNAHLFALFATYGLTNNLDVNLALPFASVSMKGQSTAMLIGPSSGVFHFFVGGTQNNPNVTDVVNYDESASGISDIAVRLKYSFLRGIGTNLAALLDVRLPTGKKEDFLGTGETNIKLSFIGSRKFDRFTPHLNLGYERRPAELDNDKVELIAGFDQKMAEGLTLAVDFLGRFDVGDEAINFFDKENETILEQQGPLVIRRELPLTNVPRSDKDNTFDASLGFRYAPSERVSFLGNVLVPMNDSGLRSKVAPTLGLTVTF